MRNLRTEVVTLYLVIAILFLGTAAVDSSLDYRIFRRNGSLLKNYETINQAIVAYNQSSTAFRLYNRNKNLHFYDEYVQYYQEVTTLLTGLGEAFKESEETVLYYRISMQMLQERNTMIESYVNYQSISGSLSQDYEWIFLMGNYVTGFLNDLLSAYLDQINRQNSQAQKQFITSQLVTNSLKIAFLLLLAISLEFMIRRSRQKMQEASHVMQEIGKRNFEVEDIQLTSYDDINEFISTTNT
ncbi:MAG: hypothetical protein EOM68_11505, partial [Spirochaetia bacterium]|nr:hypothetical protein [Spirochaetia bacterium]